MSGERSKYEQISLEIHELITARMAEEITKEQMERLEFLVIHDEMARKIYVEHMQDSVSLRWWA